MSLFNKILEKLGLRKDQKEEGPAVTSGAGATTSTPSKPAIDTTGATGSVSRKPAPTAPSARTSSAGKPAGKAPTSEKGVRTSASTADRRQHDEAAVKHDPAPLPAAPRAMSRVDVMNMLEEKARGTGLNWKQSISDLLFLLDLDNSYNARLELAKELGAPQEVMGDSARMNTWLHKEVLRKIAENGGNISQNLLDL